MSGALRTSWSTHRTAPSAPPPRRRRRAAMVGLLAMLVPGALVTTATPALAATDLARTGVATASASQDDVDGSFPASHAIDGDPGTRWASGNGPDEDVEFTAWLQVDLGASAAVDGVTLAWEDAYAASYEVQVATAAPEDDASWTTVASEASDGGSDTVTFDAPADARYVRVVMLERVAFDWDPARPHWYGYSLYSLEVLGVPDDVVVSFARGATSVPAGGTATVPLLLNAPAEGDVTVRVASTGGTAAPGTDYTALDQVVTIPAGATTQQVAVETVDHGPLAPVTTVELTLTDPTGVLLGGRTTSTVTITPHGDLPDVGSAHVLDDFESGVPAGYTTWGSAASVTPALSTVAADRAGAPAGNQALQALVGGAPAAGDWFGFTHDLAAPADWSAHDGFAFWFHGTGAGGQLRFELKSGGQLFERSVVDDTAGWRQVSTAFAQLRLKGDPASDARFDPAAATGFAVTLTDLGPGAWQFDDIALYERATTIQDFEGDVPFAEPGGTVGHFTWGSDGAQVSLGVEQQDRDGAPAGNHVLAGEYLIAGGGWGGYSHNLAAPQDWSSYRGIRLLWYASQDTRPASPTAGADIKVELKDGGPDGEHSELWAATFKDTWSPEGSRWRVVEIPFADFRLGGYQPGDAATRNGTLDLTSARGYALTMVPGTAQPVRFAVDDVELFGSATPAPTVTVAPVDDVVLVDPGETAQVRVRVTTTDGEPLTEPVTVSFTDQPGTAEAGTHYTAASGTLTFDAGTASGAEQTIEVATAATADEDDARSFTLALTADGLAATSARVVLNAVGALYLDSTAPVDERVADLLGRMTLAEKVGQMAQAERLGLQSPAQIAELGLGSVLSGGGSVPQDNTATGWADMVDGFQRQALSTRLQVPLIYGVDAVHGHNNVVGATIFPHNSGLGAARDPDLVRRVGEATAVETRATGVPWTFAPCLCVTRDERWGRSYEAFSEDPALVSVLADDAVIGLQGPDPTDVSGPGRVLATAKHWLGDGGTRYEPSLAGSGYPIDQGITYAGSLAELMRVHGDPYVPAIEAGVGSIMPSYSAVDLGAGPLRMHEHTQLNTEVLKGDLGFDGFLVSDWEGIDKLPGGTYTEKVARSVNSGLDMAMAPYNFGAFLTSLTQNVESGAVSQARVDDAVRRILTAKMHLGLFEQPLADRTHADAVGSAEHRAVAREAAAASQVLLKDDDVLPLGRDQHLYVAGSNADDLGHQMGGWTISWQGGSGDITPGTSILEGIRAAAPGAEVTYSADASAPMDGADVGVVVVGEPPYAEGIGDVGNNGRSLELPAADRAAIDAVCDAMECVVLVVAGRPQLVTDRLDAIDALVASWLPGSEGAGVADVLFGDVPFTGRLPISWPATADGVPVNVGDATYAPAYAYGWGLRTDAQRARLADVVESLEPGAQRDAVQAVLDADVWDGDTLAGAPQSTTQAVRLLVTAAGTFDGEWTPEADLVVSVLRDVAQAAVIAGTAADDAVRLTADAEHALMSGRAGEAATLLAAAAGIDLPEPAESTTTLRLSRERAPLGHGATATVTVRAEGAALTGTVDLLVAGEVVASGELVATGPNRAQARIDLPDSLPAGTHEVVAAYRGTADVAPSTSGPARYVVTRGIPSLSTAGTDWSVRRDDPKVVQAQVKGVEGVTPTGTVSAWVVGGPTVTATLGPDGAATLRLPDRTRTSLVVVLYSGDQNYTATAALPRILLVR
ncbi:glycoside hydrolase family 3 N-terminal domain-containing protein [Cellulomonas chengniuliangii]|uniref:glycoside hydrolase family 3 N-terminal domain-containing protein n=1 Tax=Cellulomonas chengniuliangii TaxID=2968084 RepID=UPI001D0E7386|nr:glycoside hydrolase family 3 N-terminal domain-containing protein [Cellulomonas chengniuliangii]MCC2318839.1 glycoside hydrolase family 3 C-terminal domain-containing protein [Cellulomonas chengniuliangii]